MLCDSAGLTMSIPALPRASLTKIEDLKSKSKLSFLRPSIFVIPAGLTLSILALPRASLTKIEDLKSESKLSFLRPSIFVIPAGFKPTTF